MSKLQDMWKWLSKLDADLDDVEKAVDVELRPRPQKGRVTPFFQTERLRFDYFDYTERSFPLVQSAGRVTRVTRLSYSVSLNITALVGGVLQTTFQAMRPTPRGMTMLDNTATGDNETIFDFEWSLSLGTTERDYVTGLSRNQRRVASGRRSLGNPENDRQLLFCEKNPLVLETNEFLSFKVKPLLYFVDTPNDFERVSVDVNLSYAGYREFGYGE